MHRVHSFCKYLFLHVPQLGFDALLLGSSCAKHQYCNKGKNTSRQKIYIPFAVSNAQQSQKKPSNATIMKLALDDFRLFLRLFLSPVSSSASTSLLNQRQLTQFSAVSDARPQSKVEVYPESVSLQHQNSPC